MPDTQKHVLICGGTACTGLSKSLEPELMAEIRKQGLEGLVKVTETVYFGLCGKCPMLIIYPDETVYERVKPEDLAEIVESHLKNGIPVERLVSKEGIDRSRIRVLGGADFFGKQLRITLRNTGVVDPESVEDYLEVKGYEALAKVLDTMTPQEVIDAISDSGLRGRGGAGYPTGTEVEAHRRRGSRPEVRDLQRRRGRPRRVHGPDRYRGRPAQHPRGHGDRRLCHRREHRATSTSAPSTRSRSSGSGTRSSRPRSTACSARTSSAADSSFDIEIKLGAGAFVCGEETALIDSIEGRRGMPGRRPPYPSVSGLWGKPTLINNVETWANIPPIILNGAEWFAAIGTEGSKGTKVFALAGKVDNTGLVEVPMGMTPAGDHLRHRRRHQGRQEVQGRADRRPLRRLHPRAVPRHARWTTSRSSRPARSWAPAA